MGWSEARSMRAVGCGESQAVASGRTRRTVRAGRRPSADGEGKWMGGESRALEGGESRRCTAAQRGRRCAGGRGRRMCSVLGILETGEDGMLGNGEANPR
jgi:hypothetical protein